MRALQALPGPHSQAELAFLTNLDVWDLKEALVQLTNTYFVSLHSTGYAAAPDTQYQLTEFSLGYLDKHHPVTASERDRYVQNRTKLHESGRRLQSQHHAYRYDTKTLDIRGTGDFNVARHLMNAISLAHRGHFADAHQVIAEAQLLSPVYHEVHRVEAYLLTLENRYGEASNAYERAMELAPDNGPVHYFSGLFHLQQGNSDKALGNLQKTAQLEPDDVEPRLAVARAHLQLGNHQEARDVAGQILRTHNLQLPTSVARQASEIVIRAAVGHAHAAADEEDWPVAVAALQELVEVLPHVPLASLDPMVREKLNHARVLADACERQSRDPYVTRAAVEVLATLSSVTLDGILELEQRSYGRVKTLVHESYYGFIREAGSSREFFFHANDLLARREDWLSVMEGSEVSFIPDFEDPRGPRARRVRLTLV